MGGKPRPPTGTTVNAYQHGKEVIGFKVEFSATLYGELVYPTVKIRRTDDITTFEQAEREAYRLMDPMYKDLEWYGTEALFAWKPNNT